MLRQGVQREGMELISELVSSVHLATLLLWEVCQHCIATLVSLMLRTLRLSEALPVSRVSDVLAEVSKAPPRLVSIPVPATDCRSFSSPIPPLLPPRFGTTAKKLTVGDIRDCWDAHAIWQVLL